MFVTEPFHVRTKYKYPLWSLTRKKNRLLIQTRTYLFIIASNKDKSQVPQVPIVSPNQKTSKPEWLRAIAPERVHSRFRQLKDTVAELGLHTVCEEAQCPNIGECWNGGTATVMLLGDTCTRGCRFCAVKTSNRPPPPDPLEPFKVAQALAEWNLDYVVLTSVDRDDILDGGADHFARTVELIKLVKPEMLVECLVGDFSGNRQSVERLATCGMEVFAHNLETVARLQKYVRDRRANYQQSLDMLREAKKLNPRLITKSSIMLGLGETDLEVKQTMLDLRKVGVEALTLGQYLRPTPQHLNVVEYITPERFDHWKRNGLEMGFLYVASGPLVRSSYKAGEYYMKNIIESQKNIHSYE
ncbi:Lipoyl synthase, apicoplast [Galdieria sulphuraria]|uniref:Lipoyl synthase, mitochondrial n=1 Tax=Galdieria sulphuraria TaxID=130081 RepID=M2XKX4_GALSU|nr:lipoic acid synthetase [Galdieria sulphuraria]EME30787.1 lipoic acid synthetase [Galdieria sulphuraria]GJD10864.1 Lipoyl synthase, apicoplast [Galdieria sulphuraria]|eukprot:XP_005707307.1 lipoic acid synthetase [Galdieria sulphuraria]